MGYISHLKASFKFFWRKILKFFPVRPFIVFLMNIKVPWFQENSLAQTNSWLRVCTLMTYLRIALEKSRFIDSLVEHFKKMKTLNVSIFSFIILNLVKKGILDPSCYYIHWHMYERIDCKLLLWRTLRENYGSNESIKFNYHCTKSS